MANAAIVVGQVVNASGNPVAFADVRVAAADPSCRAGSGEIGAIADANGGYAMTIESGVGPAHSGCVVVRAFSGGASGTASAATRFTSAEAERSPVRIKVALDQKAQLTATEAERLVRLFAHGINEPSGAAPGELQTYVLWGGEALRVALEQYREQLGSVASVAPSHDANGTDPTYRRFSYELRGSNRNTARIDVHQEELIRLHSLLLDYGMRSQAFMLAYVRAISSGDAQQLARILNPDDVDFPVERARELIINYRLRYDTATLRPEFVSASERRNTITWRLRGRSPGGEEVVETIELMTADGVIGVVGL